MQDEARDSQSHSGDAEKRETSYTGNLPNLLHQGIPNREGVEYLVKSAEAANLLLLGPPGMGKTHLAVPVAIKSIAPTGKPVMFTGIAIRCIADGMIAERWVNVDYTGLIRQLGIGV